MLKLLSTPCADPIFNTFLDYFPDNTNVITNLVDGLLEMIIMETLIPALAEDWSCFEGWFDLSTYRLLARMLNVHC